MEEFLETISLIPFFVQNLLCNPKRNKQTVTERFFAHYHFMSLSLQFQALKDNTKRSHQGAAHHNLQIIYSGKGSRVTVEDCYQRTNKCMVPQNCHVVLQ